MLHANEPPWMLLVFGLQNGLNVVTNQAAMCAQAPANATGAAAGLLRLALLLTIAGLGLPVATIADRTLTSQHRTP